MRSNRQSAESTSERGIALMEFLVAIPFLVIMSTSIIDIALVLNQYMLITNAVHAGTRMGSEYAALETGTFSGISAGQSSFCPVSATAPKNHGEIQARVVELINMSNRRLVPNTLCVFTGVRTGLVPATNPKNNTIFVRIEVRYQGFFPAFNNMPIIIEASGPYVS